MSLSEVLERGPGTVGGESEFPGSFDTSGSVRTSNLYLASVRIFPFSSLISHNGNSKFSFSPIVIPFSPEGNSDSPPTVPEEIMHLFQSEIYESDDSSVLAVPPLF
jgi:hypothetical protein